MRTILALLAAVLVLACTGCTAHTTVFNPTTGKPTFTTNANFESMKLGADGSLAMTGVNHSTPQRAIGETITARANGFAGVVTALGTAALIK